MRKILPYLFALICLIAIFKTCENKTTTKKYTPEIKGKFESNKVVNIPIKKSQPYDNNVPLNDEFLQKQIDSLLKINDFQTADFANANDSLKKLLFEKAIELNAFKQVFNDSNVIIEVNGIAQGTVKNLRANYTIKPISIPPQKVTVFALRTGLEYGNSTELNKGLTKANLEFEFKRGNSFSTGYDSEKRVWIGYKKTLFTVKK